MAITCDYCGKAATVANMPAGENWLYWMHDASHGDDGMYMYWLPGDRIEVICVACLMRLSKRLPVYQARGE